MRLNNYNNRKLEWSVGFYTAFLGVFLMLPVTSLYSYALSGVKAVMPEFAWGLVFFATGAFHLFALHINGRAAWTPFVRCLACVISCWVYLFSGLSIASYAPFSTGAFTYFFLAVGFCGPCILAASQDCGKELKIREAARNAKF